VTIANKQVPIATNQHATTEELLEAESSVVRRDRRYATARLTRLYNSRWAVFCVVRDEKVTVGQAHGIARHRKYRVSQKDVTSYMVTSFYNNTI
jgi:ketosteroid isomerase-like protein